MNTDCLHCGEPVTVTDDSVPISAGELQDGQLVFTPRLQHRECAMRAVSGSVGHLAELCSCFGGNLEDPPGLTKRESAKLAYRIWLRMSRIAEGMDPQFRTCT